MLLTRRIVANFGKSTSFENQSLAVRDKSLNSVDYVCYVPF